jgi:trans-aconitate methyltransferase
MGAVRPRSPDPYAGDQPGRYDRDILHGLALPPDGRILELGSGTGEFTARLAPLVPLGEVIGVDADRDVVAAARLRAEDRRLSFHVCRVQDVAALVAEESVDLVVSRGVLHRLPAAEHPALLSAVYRVLRPGAVFRAELSGVGQLAAVRQIADAEAAAVGGSPPAWYLPGPEDYRPLLLAAGLQVQPGGWVCLLHQPRVLRGEAEVLGLLRGQVLPSYVAGLPAAVVPRFRRRVEERVLAELRTADGSCRPDFVRLELCAHRPKGEFLI